MKLRSVKNPRQKILLILFFILGNSLLSPAQKNKPNIIIIFADDLGYGELGCYGQKIIKTPHIDSLAANGLRFTDFYSGSALCAPARCQLLTGFHSGHSAIRANYEMAQGPSSFTDENEKGQMPLPAGSFTVAEMLKSNGYTTACIGKWGLGMNERPGSPNSQGFDYFFGYLDQKQAHNYYPTHLWENGERYALNNKRINIHQKINSDQAVDSVFNLFIGNEYSVDVMASKVNAFVEKNQASPFFLYFAVTLPHLALQIPDKALHVYKGVFDEKMYLGENGYCPVRFPRATYAAMVTYLDEKVGALMQQIKKLKLDKNTLIIFTSDNGSAFNAGGNDPDFFKTNGALRNYKGSLYEGGIRVPFIAYWPGVIQPGLSNRQAAHYDLMATFRELADAKAVISDGLSLWPEFKRKKSTPHPFLYFELYEYGGQQAVRMKNWKAVKRNMRADKTAPWELYDLMTDSAEKNNIANQHPEVIKKIEEIVNREHRHSVVPEWNFMEK